MVLRYDQVWSIECSNLTMFQIRFGISQVELGIWSHFGLDIPNQNSDLGMFQIRFGTKSHLVYNISIINDLHEVTRIPSELGRNFFTLILYIGGIYICSVYKRLVYERSVYKHVY